MNSISSLFYEDGDVIVQEDGDNILQRNQELQFIHQNHIIFMKTIKYLDGFVGTNVDRINKRLFLSDVDVENSAILLEDNNMLLETNDILRSEDIQLYIK